MSEQQKPENERGQAALIARSTLAALTESGESDG